MILFIAFNKITPNMRIPIQTLYIQHTYLQTALEKCKDSSGRWKHCRVITDLFMRSTK